jgi:hypothetical protein
MQQYSRKYDSIPFHTKQSFCCQCGATLTTTCNKEESGAPSLRHTDREGKKGSGLRLGGGELSTLRKTFRELWSFCVYDYYDLYNTCDIDLIVVKY